MDDIKLYANEKIIENKTLFIEDNIIGKFLGTDKTFGYIITKDNSQFEEIYDNVLRFMRNESKDWQQIESISFVGNRKIQIRLKTSEVL